MEQLGFHLSIKQHNIKTTLEEVIAILHKKADEKEIKLQFEADKESVLIEGDADRLKQVFLNLVSNAISYTPDGGHVFLRLRESASSIFVEVKDTGIGMEKSEVPRIFERFYRVDKARSRNSGGTGLGLAIVKHIVEAHKGTIIVTSQVGKGTTFLIELKKRLDDE
jgi:two-component system phosphate regulon sensor histidine kinase PhoR